MIARLLQLATASLIAITLAGCAGTGAKSSLDSPSYGYPAAEGPFPARTIE